MISVVSETKRVRLSAPRHETPAITCFVFAFQSVILVLATPCGKLEAGIGEWAARRKRGVSSGAKFIKLAVRYAERNVFIRRIAGYFDCSDDDCHEGNRNTHDEECDQHLNHGESTSFICANHFKSIASPSAGGFVILHLMLIVANWKAYVEEFAKAKKLFALGKRLAQTTGTTIVLAPPAPLLGALAVRNKSKVAFAAQDVSATTGGAVTGEITAQTYAAAGATHAIVGHSERRAAGRHRRHRRGETRSRTRARTYAHPLCR